MNIYELKNHKEREFEIVQKQFKDSLFNEFKLERLSSRLQNWYKLEWQEFFKEILKTGEKPNYKKKLDWERFFRIQKEKALTLDKQIQAYKYKLVKTEKEKVKV